MRSALYVPADAPRKLDKALNLETDEIIVDLEDAVPPPARAGARRSAAEWLARNAPGAGPGIWVRVNPGAAGIEDAAAVAVPGVAGVVAAKTGSAAGPAALGPPLRAAEERYGLAAGSFGIVALVETAAGVLAAPEIARAPRVVRLQLGEADLRAELGVEPGPEGLELLYARSRIVLASAAAGLPPPPAPVCTDVRDTEALRRTTLAFRALGFRGRACIHPAQLAVVNEVFTPSDDQLGRARDLVERYERALASGAAVGLDPDGGLIDEAVVRSARRLLSGA
ncbi:HpcH/HpaI aldolase/citrate lyase family protein [Streptomyces sp. NPDC094448]|uniref:HpcH/HpaI aldolase/citrate lyase family protein n=1 Tax=Streptomyces sp. NPDC094448 TaxID=3366063 RepID=UPI0038051199